MRLSPNPITVEIFFSLRSLGTCLVVASSGGQAWEMCWAGLVVRYRPLWAQVWPRHAPPLTLSGFKGPG